MDAEFNQIDMFEIKNCLVVPIQLDLYDEFVLQLQKTILARLANSLIIGVVIDVSAVKIMDSINLNNIIQLCKMIRLMGKETAVIGFQPSVANVLPDFDNINLSELNTHINLESSLKYLHLSHQSRAQS